MSGMRDGSKSPGAKAPIEGPIGVDVNAVDTSCTPVSKTQKGVKGNSGGAMPGDASG